MLPFDRNYMPSLLSKVTVLFSTITMLTSCQHTTDPDALPLQAGDILMQVAAPSPFVDAIVASSAQADTLQFAHCGMLVSLDSDSLVVLEATTPGGVKYTSIDEFLAQSDSIGDKPAVIAMRVVPEAGLDLDATVARATARLGQDYDWSFRPDNGKTYCSELLQTSYVDVNGNRLFDTIPLNFRDVDGVTVPFWIELYNKLGEEIPQDVPGTSPTSIARSSCLQKVYQFY